MAYGVESPSSNNSDEEEPSLADDPKDPSNNNSQEVSDLGMALIFISIGCFIGAILLYQRECYKYFTCAEQETQVLALLVIGAVLMALGINSKEERS